MAKKASLLIVDDKESMVKMLAKLLAGLYRIETASSGAEAVNLFAQKWNYNLAAAKGFSVCPGKRCSLELYMDLCRLFTGQ